MPITRCPGCAQELDIDTQWLGELVRCDACNTEFIAQAVAPPLRSRVEDYEDRPRRRRLAYDDYDEYDERPRRRRRPKKSHQRKQNIDCCWLGIVDLAPCMWRGNILGRQKHHSQDRICRD